MIIGTNHRVDEPGPGETTIEVDVDPDGASALVIAIDHLLSRHGLELLYLFHHEDTAFVDIVPRAADLALLNVPKGTVRGSLKRLRQ